MREAPKIKWCTLDNLTETATLKQHGYIASICYTPYFGEEYEGNKALCGKAYATEDGEAPMLFANMDFYKDEPSQYACKRCLKKYQKINQNTIQ